jgi:hypothetical protein
MEAIKHMDKKPTYKPFRFSDPVTRKLETDYIAHERKANSISERGTPIRPNEIHTGDLKQKTRVLKDTGDANKTANRPVINEHYGNNNFLIQTPIFPSHTKERRKRSKSL